MNILLTGSSGFVGSYFVNNYTSKYCIKTFSFIKDDFEALDVESIDVVIHLSALVHQMDGASAAEYERVNVMQTLNLAKKAKNAGVKQFVFMSTVKVYGEERILAYDETSRCRPQDEYGKSKLKAELELLKLENNNFKVSIIRAPIVYGYGVKANIKSLITLIKRFPVLPFGDIANKRSMVYIGNLCYIIDIIIQKEKSGTFLVSDDKSISITILIEIISKSLDKKVYLIKIPFFESLLKLVKPSFYKRLYENLEVDTSETKKVLNLKNPYTIEDGIKFMIKGEK